MQNRYLEKGRHFARMQRYGKTNGYTISSRIKRLREKNQVKGMKEWYLNPIKLFFLKQI